jgi:prepilin-type N-terminal cleavage/methylation domain-containing protein
MRRNGIESEVRPAFTLIEIMIVVVLLSILAALAVPVIQTSTDEAEQIAFAADVRILADAAMRYRFENGRWLEDSATGTVPQGWAPYIDVKKWTSLTPIGGSWDCELDSFGIKAAFGVDFVNGGGADRSDAYMEEVDEIIDNGDLASGQFRKIAPGRYYFILADP